MNDDRERLIFVLAYLRGVVDARRAMDVNEIHRLATAAAKAERVTDIPQIMKEVPNVRQKHRV